MININNKSDLEINHLAYEAIRKELGTTALIRFLQLHERGHGNYTEERDRVQMLYTVESLADEIINNRKSQINQ